MNIELSICGLICSECKYYGNRCKGCQKEKGNLFWTSFYKINICSIYNCCRNEKQFDTCGECINLPCHLYDDLKDPKMSEQEHTSELAMRINRLKD